VILRLAVLVEHRLVTDGHKPMASTVDAYHRAVKRKKLLNRYPLWMIDRRKEIAVAVDKCRKETR